MANKDNVYLASKPRYEIFDGLRGLALLGIVLANFPEFGLWTFLIHEMKKKVL